MRRIAVFVIVVGIVIGVALDRLIAQSDPPRSYVVPYQGAIDLDGAPLHGALGMRFSLYDSPDAGAPSYWQESHAGVDAVQARNGRFAVRLGEITPLDETHLARSSIYLGIAVLELDANDEPTGVERELVGRQLLGAVPFAWSAAPGHAFHSDGELRTGIGANQAVLGHSGTSAYLENKNGGGIDFVTQGSVRATVDSAGVALAGNKLSGMANGVASGEGVHAGQFDHSLGPATRANSGYQKLPGGLILQWQRVQDSGSTSPQTFALPIAFPTAGLMAQVSWDNLMGTASYFVSVDQVNWTLQVSSNHSATWMNLLAIGY